MSFPRMLDEISDRELKDELGRRRRLRLLGLCSYCESPFSAPPCRLHESPVEGTPEGEIIVKRVGDEEGGQG